MEEMNEMMETNELVIDTENDEAIDLYEESGLDISMENAMWALGGAAVTYLGIKVWDSKPVKNLREDIATKFQTAKAKAAARKQKKKMSKPIDAEVVEEFPVEESEEAS